MVREYVLNTGNNLRNKKGEIFLEDIDLFAYVYIWYLVTNWISEKKLH